jgi:hypothetical protein
MTGSSADLENKLHVTTVRFDLDLAHAARADAKRLGVPLSTYVRDAVRERVAASRYRGALGELHARVVRLERDQA